MPLVKISNIVDNMYRDRNLFPTDPTKIAALVESINQTGFWDNILCRVQFNEVSDGTVILDKDHLIELMADGSLDLESEKLELAYGHHRLDALVEAGFDEIDIPVKFITDEDMLRIMSNENKEGWGGSIKSILETVRQVKGQLNSLFQDYSGYADYVATVGKEKVAFSKKQFQDAKVNGIGYRTVQAFLGDSWNPTDVRIPMAAMKAMEHGYFEQKDIFHFPTLGILDAFTACIVALYEGGKIKERVEVDKLDKEGKIVRDADGNPVKVKKDQFTTVLAPAWPLAFKKKMTKSLLEQCLPSDTKDDQVEEVLDYVKETILTQSEINKRRVNMLKKQSAPTASGTAEYRLKKEIVRAYFPSFDPATPDEEREKLHAQLVGKDMKDFMADPDIAGWGLLDGMVADLEDMFKVLLSPLEEGASDLQEEMDQEQGTSESYESDYKDLEIELDEKDESGAVIAKPIGQVARDVVDLLLVAKAGMAGLTLRASEIDLDSDEVLNEALRSAITDTCVLYASAASTEDLGYLVREVMESLIDPEVATVEETPVKEKKKKKAAKK